DDVEVVETEDEPELERLSDATEPDAESIGPDSVPSLRSEEELESEAPADVAATHGPDAVEVAAAEGEVDLDTVHVEHAEPDRVPAGIAVQRTDSEADGSATEGRTVETPSEGAAPTEPAAPVPTDEGTPTA